jgi:hypothetical protein
MTWELAVIYFCVALEIACLVFMIRAVLVAKLRRRELDRIHAALMAKAEDFTLTSKHVLDAYADYRAATNFHLMVLQVHKWTYHQFFPEKRRDPTAVH